MWLMDVELSVKGITDDNRKEKFLRAVTSLSKAMKLPATVERKDSNKEEYPYLAQEKLYQKHVNEYGLVLDDLYSRLCATLGLPFKKRFEKAIDPKAPKFGKEILFDPETGRQISEKALEKLLAAVDKFLNRNVADKRDEFVISQAAVSRIISNLRSNGVPFEELREMDLDALKVNDTPWDQITTYKQLKEAFPGSFDDLSFRGRILGNYITQINDDTRQGIVNILDNGFAAGLSKGEISQNLFDHFGALNKDWSRIYEFEASNIFNQQYINEQRRDVIPGEELYFIRREFMDNRTCSFCARAANKPVIAKWVDKPLQDENIDDPVASIALWAGKSNIGRKPDEWWWAEGPIHPHCRGSWDRYYEEYGDFNL